MPAAANGTLMSSSRTEALAPIQERNAPSPTEFRSEILAGEQPVVMRAVARDWPLVVAARQDPRKAMSLLEAAGNATLTNVLRTEPEMEGRFHYGMDLQSFNFIRGQGNIAGIIAGLRDEENKYRPCAIAAQAMDAERFFPGFLESHRLPLVPSTVGPRLWIGNAAKVATHNDP